MKLAMQALCGLMLMLYINAATPAASLEPPKHQDTKNSTAYAVIPAKLVPDLDPGAGIQFLSLTAVGSPLSALSSPLPLHNTLDPHSAQARTISDISWVLFIAAAAIFVVVMMLAAYALFGAPHKRARLAQRALIVSGGIVFPIVTLTALLIYVFADGSDLLHSGKPALHIEVIGEQFWWRVRYLDTHGALRFETANEIHIPTGTTVELRMRSADVIHSFWVPNLHGKLDMIPGHVNVMRVQADRPGTFRGQCAEYCGAQHAKMAFFVQAVEPAAFEQWRAAQSQPAHAPDTGELQRGHELFVANACATCHTVRGTEARGVLGPELTHVGSRRTIGAGLLPNNVGALGGWIANSQALKPGNRMPAFTNLDGAELRALAAYMASLQ